MMLRRPPPSAKGRSSMETVLETLPTQGTTAKLMSAICNVCQEAEDLVSFETLLLVKLFILPSNAPDPVLQKQ